MALTVEATTPQSGLDVWGRQKVVISTVTFDDAYDTGGESFTPAMVGLSEFTFVSASCDAANLAGAYVIQYDYTNQTLAVYGVEQDADAATTETLDEEDSLADLSGMTVRVLCVGH